MNKNKQIRLYNLSKGARIKADCFDEEGKKIGDFIIFDHLDGMYSYCTVANTNKVIHLSVITPLKKVKDYYEIYD